MIWSALSRLILKHVMRPAFFSGFALFFSLSALAAPIDPHEPSDKLVSSTSKIALTVIDTLPESGVKSGLKRYYELVDPSTYGQDQNVAISNSGISNYFEGQFFSNACFAEKALLFYRDVRATTRSSQKQESNDVRHNRPSLGDKSGVNRKDLPAGWLFSKALKYSHGNPNAALTLIGMCGHDDQKQGYFDNNAVTQLLTQKGIPYRELYSPVEEQYYEETPCPPETADFFIAGALSAKADIPEKLKKKILEVQYPGKKPTQIASKNYHVLGAAFMTCQMIEAGLSPFLAVRVETTAASIYRGIRLCQEIEKPAALFFALQKNPEVKKRPRHLHFDEFVLQKALERGKSKSCLKQQDLRDPFCELLKASGAPLDTSLPRLEERARELIQNNLDKLIASGLYASWHVSGEVAGINLPCGRDQLLGPHPIMKWLVSQANWPLNICGGGLTSTACRRALDKIKTWELDFDWTVSQHLAGAQFAAEVCKPLSSGANSMDLFCD